MNIKCVNNFHTHWQSECMCERYRLFEPIVHVCVYLFIYFCQKQFPFCWHNTNIIWSSISFLRVRRKERKVFTHRHLINKRYYSILFLFLLARCTSYLFLQFVLILLWKKEFAFIIRNERTENLMFAPFPLSHMASFVRE